MDLNNETYENYPSYWGDKVRYKNFLNDLKEIMTNKPASYTVSAFVSYIIDKYELRKSKYFNQDACELLLYCVFNHYKQFVKKYEKKSVTVGNTAEDMNLLRSVKGK